MGVCGHTASYRDKKIRAKRAREASSGLAANSSRPSTESRSEQREPPDQKFGACVARACRSVTATTTMAAAVERVTARKRVVEAAAAAAVVPVTARRRRRRVVVAAVVAVLVTVRRRVVTVTVTVVGVVVAAEVQAITVSALQEKGAPSPWASLLRQQVRSPRRLTRGTALLPSC